MTNDVDLLLSSNVLECGPIIFNTGVFIHYVFHLLIFNIHLFICSLRKLQASLILD